MSGNDDDEYLTSEGAGKLIGWHRWQVRQVADLLAFAGRIKLQRAGQLRLIRRSDLAAIAAELEKRTGWRRRETVTQ